MARKATAKPVLAILNRMNAGDEFDIITFPEEVILNDPVENWPLCECLMSWHSDGFPLHKAQAYVRLREPFVINDVFKQSELLDRRTVHQKLTQSGVPVPTHIVVSRTEEQAAAGVDPEGFKETCDSVELDGVVICKPFVEKPVDAEDHNIWIYYPSSSGGGVKMLFRKADHPGTVRRNGSFLYEEFLSTGGADVKVYAVGFTYAHAEARKSPVVDGKVQRSAEGKELRFPVLLTPTEKEIARLVSSTFQQTVCGFDLLRADNSGRSFVCDVNGWSMVKNSKKYYDDAAGILRSLILGKLDPKRLKERPLLPPLAAEEEAVSRGSNFATLRKHDSTLPDLADLDAEIAHTEKVSAKEELRCVLAVIRHGDRTPKQKMKLKVTQPPLIAVFDKFKDEKGKQAKLKSPAQLQAFLDAVKCIFADPDAIKADMREKLHIVKSVLEHGGSFSGINRKVQLKPCKSDPLSGEVTELQLIVKWGGVLTHLGRQQAEDLGYIFRKIMYPASIDDGGLLRLHATFRHDFKCHSSDEGRVQTTAAAVIKSLLDLEGSSLTPILVSLVNRNSVILDAFGKGASEDIAHSKRILYQLLTMDPETGISHCATTSEEPLARGETPSPRPRAPRAPSQDSIGVSSGSEGGDFDRSSGSTGAGGQLRIERMPDQPLALLREVVTALRELVDALADFKARGGAAPAKTFYAAMLQDACVYKQDENEPYGVEDRAMMHDRWCKLLATFYSPETDTFDISKIPDIYDSAKHDCIHNSRLGLDFSKLFPLAKKLADCVIGAEYGVTPDFKMRIATKIASELLGKLMLDVKNVHNESLRSEEAAEALRERRSKGDSRGQSDDADASSTFGTSPKADAVHRLAPVYLDDNRINSPQRHVRTRMYFTSESHIHALLNILRYTEVRGESLLSAAGRHKLAETREYDYLTQIVLRMYERKDVPISDEGRFRIEILFSPGACYDPEAPPGSQPRTQPRMMIQRGTGVSLKALERHLCRYAADRTPTPDANAPFVP